MDKYIKLDQKILNWDWYKDINTFKVFLHLLLKANFEDVKIQGIEVPCGSFISSYQTLATETGLTVQNIRTALNHLKSTGELTIHTYPKFSVFTVKNYRIYQESNTTTDNQITGNEHVCENQKTQIEEKKINTKTTYKQKIEMFDVFWNIYPRKQSRALAEQAYTDLILSEKLKEEQLIIAAKNYAEACRILKRHDEYVYMPHNWMEKSAWVDYLPENYKKPEAPRTKEKVGTGFSNFKQRDYDFDKLEEQLLQSQG